MTNPPAGLLKATPMKSIQRTPADRCRRGVLVAMWLAKTICAPAAPGAEPEFIFERDVPVPMRDGTKLAANIFRPRGEGQHPVVLLRTPYGKPDEKFSEARRYTAAGYAMVTQDCRGKGKSEGAWDPFAHDAEDGFDPR